MSKGKGKRIVAKTERVQRDAVTGELEVTILDAEQKAYERCCQAIDGQMIALSDAAPCERLARRLLARIGQMIRSDAGVA